jgi:hypothetical protein
MEKIRYFIFDGEALKQTSEKEYYQWSAKKYLPKNFRKKINGKQHLLTASYVGSLDKTEWDAPAPFILQYFEDDVKNNDSASIPRQGTDFIEYFENPVMLNKRRDELIESIEANIPV